MGLQDLLRSVTDAITRHNDPNQPDYPQDNLVGYVTDLFRRHDSRRVRPASEDPYGDPADSVSYGGHQVRPASEDPYGDPADSATTTYRGQRVRPASEDPYGDPADQRY